MRKIVVNSVKDLVVNRSRNKRSLISYGCYTFASSSPFLSRFLSTVSDPVAMSAPSESTPAVTLGNINPKVRWSDSSSSRATCASRSALSRWRRRGASASSRPPDRRPKASKSAAGIAVAVDRGSRKERRFAAADCGAAECDLAAAGGGG
uniref:Uncharacterized protein n=1 Tax=Kalanchoe fedtschenkoi TaxID=63787 RepID=A0A7N0VLU1_KALFE